MLSDNYLLRILNLICIPRISIDKTVTVCYLFIALVKMWSCLESIFRFTMEFRYQFIIRLL